MKKRSSTPKAAAADTPELPTLRLDFLSDVACPWCAVGLASLEHAIARTRDVLRVSLHFQPFELNPAMGPEGQDTAEYLSAKFGTTPEQQAAMHENIRQRGALVGFVFRPQGRVRIVNTLDAHRLLHWAGEEDTQSLVTTGVRGGHQLALKRALLKAYFTDGRDPSDHAILTALALDAGLDGARAAQVLGTREFEANVREAQRFFAAMGINAVPTTIIDEESLISGGQSVEVFEQALRQLAAEKSA